MKKQLRPLKLHAETIRSLATSDLRSAAGGVDQTWTQSPYVCANTSLGIGCSVAICVDTNGQTCTAQATFTC